MRFRFGRGCCGGVTGVARQEQRFVVPWRLTGTALHPSHARAGTLKALAAAAARVRSQVSPCWIELARDHAFHVCVWRAFSSSVQRKETAGIRGRAKAAICNCALTHLGPIVLSCAFLCACSRPVRSARRRRTSAAAPTPPSASTASRRPPARPGRRRWRRRRRRWRRRRPRRRRRRPRCASRRGAQAGMNVVLRYAQRTVGMTEICCLVRLLAPHLENSQGAAGGRKRQGCGARTSTGVPGQSTGACLGRVC